MTLFMFLLILTLYFLLLYIIDRVFETLISKIISETKTNIDDKIVPLAKRVLLLTLSITGAYFFSTYLTIGYDIHVFTNKLYYSCLSFIFAYGIAQLVNVIFHSALEHHFERASENFSTALPFLNNFVRLIVYVLAVLYVLRIFDVDITPALASAGFVGVALAFAAKDFVANFFGGVSVFFDKPYLVGDYVILADKYRGEVVEIGMRSTKIRTRDDVLLTVPNSVMTTDTVVNETGFDPSLRVRISILIGYTEDLQRVEDILVSIAQSHPEVMDDQAPRVRYRSFADSGVELELLVVIAQPSEKGRLVHELIKLIHNGLRENNIVIPYPQRVMHTLSN